MNQFSYLAIGTNPAALTALAAGQRLSVMNTAHSAPKAARLRQAREALVTFAEDTRMLLATVGRKSGPTAQASPAPQGQESQLHSSLYGNQAPAKPAAQARRRTAGNQRTQASPAAQDQEARLYASIYGSQASTPQPAAAGASAPRLSHSPAAQDQEARLYASLYGNQAQAPAQGTAAEQATYKALYPGS